MISRQNPVGTIPAITPRKGQEWILPAVNNQPSNDMKNNACANHNNSKHSHGFTLIEMLLVLVILGILAGIVVPQVTGKQERARITATTTQLTGFKTALANYEIDVGSFPKGQNGLRALVTPPPDASGWKGPYMLEIPLDPWNHPYVYACPGKHAPYPYDIISFGPDGKPGSDDDITNWPKGKL